jgi:nitrate reductase alpha subunit
VSNKVDKYTPGSLPATVQDVLGNAERKQRPWADLVENIYFQLYENPTFQDLRKAIYREDCAEGSYQDDDALSAKMIKDAAKQTGTPTYDPVVADLKNAVIRRLVGVVERRWKIDRKHRRQIAEGQAYQTESDFSEDED